MPPPRHTCHDAAVVHAPSPPLYNVLWYHFNGANSYSSGRPPVPYLTREELDDPNCLWHFRLKSPSGSDAFATLLVPLAEHFTGGDLVLYPFDPNDELSYKTDSDFKTRFIPLHTTASGGPVYAAYFEAPKRIALSPVKSGARVMLV